MCVSFTPLSHSSLSGLGGEIYARNVNLTKLISQIGCLSFHLTAQRKSAIVQTPSAQIPKGFTSAWNK